jgi:hypothetical protein
MAAIKVLWIQLLLMLVLHRRLGKLSMLNQLLHSRQLGMIIQVVMELHLPLMVKVRHPSLVDTLNTMQPVR